MTHLNLELFLPTEKLPIEFYPILFILNTGRVLHGSFHAGIFYSNGTFYRAEDVACWTSIPTTVDLGNG